jgi:IS5 family transposase
LEISRAAKCLTATNQQRMRDGYQKLLGLTRGVVRPANDVVQRWSKGRLKVVGKFLRVEAQIGQLRHFLPLVEKVMTQTKERVWGGNCHVEGKVLSLFEPHTAVIRKGKTHKPNEFGRLVRIDEVENGIVSGYRVLPGNPDDTTAWMPALEQHQACFGRAPEMATADRGFFSPQNERAAQALGVKKVALPARGRLTAKRAKQQIQASTLFRTNRSGTDAACQGEGEPHKAYEKAAKAEKKVERLIAQRPAGKRKPGTEV